MAGCLLLLGFLDAIIMQARSETEFALFLDAHTYLCPLARLPACLSQLALCKDGINADPLRPMPYWLIKMQDKNVSVFASEGLSAQLNPIGPFLLLLEDVQVQISFSSKAALQSRKAQAPGRGAKWSHLKRLYQRRGMECQLSVPRLRQHTCKIQAHLDSV